MYSKKQRIISFLMAFLLIFTFVFINPFTVSKSQAFAPAVLLTPEVIKIVGGVVVSCGLGIAAGQALQEVDYEGAVQAISSSVWNLLETSEKIILTTLSIADNIVQIPVALYNSIVNKAKSIYDNLEITTDFSSLTSSSVDYPSIDIPIYNISNSINGYYNAKNYDLSSVKPVFVYDGSLSSETSNVFDSTSVTTNIFNYSNEYYTLLPQYPYYDAYKTLSPTIEQLGLKKNSYPILSLGQLLDKNVQMIGFIYLYGTRYAITPLFNINTSNITAYPTKNINDYVSKVYFVYDTLNNVIKYIIDVYDLEGNFVSQTIQDDTYQQLELLEPHITTTPQNYDISINSEIEVAPTISANDGADIVLTLPAELSSTIGLTSSDVNVGSTDVPDNPDVPDTPNTETMDNINTNVGELVTGGTLGEQLNTNIGTVEGLHGELTEQVDFGAVFDTIAQYISALDISSVTWFPTAVASFLVPFLPVISLGLILFFIDRVLNGGA